MKPNNEIVEKARNAINKEIKKYIEMDGGKIDIIKFENETLYVKMGGACKYCPAISLTLKGVVEKRLRELIPEIRFVEQIK